MSEKAIITQSFLSDIADAIREKNGSSDTGTPSEMAEAIRNLVVGGVMGVKEIQRSGVYNAADDGFAGYSRVTVQTGEGPVRVRTVLYMPAEIRQITTALAPMAATIITTEVTA